MISLTLLPSQGQAKLGPLHSIAGESDSTIDPPSNRPAGGGLSFGFRSRKDATSSEAKSSTTSKVKVRLAEDVILLPFYDRPVEVKELLIHSDSKNKQLMLSLEKLFHNSPQDWNTLRTLLFEVGREEMDDREWLAKIYSLVFARSPGIWCRLADCLGAHILDWSALSLDIRDEDNDTDSIQYDDDVFTESGSSFMTERTHARSSSGPSSTSGFEMEALHEVPQALRVPPIRARRPSSYILDDDTTALQEDNVPHARQHRSLRHRRGSSMISTGEDHDVHDFLKSKIDGFAGIRLSLSSRDRRSWSPHHIQPQPQSQLHDRLINAPSYNKDEPISTTQVRKRGVTVSGPHHHQHQQHKYTQHRRLSSLFMIPSDEHGSASHKKSPAKSSVKPLPSVVEPGKRSMPAPTFARSYSSPDVKPDQCKLGLLPDGRTRHPSAGDGEGSASKEVAALLAFKRELQLSGYKNGPAPKGSDQSTSSLSSIMSPTLSDDSFATTVSTGTSPMTRKQSTEAPFPKQLAEPPAKPNQPTALIFPLSTSPGRPRSKHLLDQLNRSENTNLISEIKSTIGEDCYKRLYDLISAKERNARSDQLLLECIAKDCFDLVDNEKDSQEFVEAHLIDEHYDQRWNTFVKLCQVWDVDSAVIREAKRRGGPALKLF
jgi:hypothetical protein